MELTGAEITVRCLAEEGVEHVFGYPGGAVLYIYDAIFKQDKFQHILVRHEQAAVHAADAYSRSSEKVGVCLVTSGPGLTNAVTGIATAYMDSIPMIIISGQVPTHAIGQDAFQECDTVGITRPCVKHNFLVKDVKDLAATIKKAFYIATTGRPGPVLVDIPKDVTMHKCEYVYPKSVEMRSYKPVVKGHPGQIKKAAQMLVAAERPMIYTGGGVILANAAKELNQLVNLLGYPCTNTLMGLGAFKASDKKFLGMPGMHGTYEANMAMQHCDVLIGIGARFDDRVIGNPKDFAKQTHQIIHVDIDPAEISKIRNADLPIVGDLKRVLPKINAVLSELKAQAGERAGLKAWWKQVREWKEEHPLKAVVSDTEIKPQHLMQEINRLTKGKAIVASDVGQHQMWAAQLIAFHEPRLWLNSGGLGSMGFGLPAALGAQVANPDQLVVAICGDGGFQMSIPELATLANFGLPVKVIVMNNGYLGMVRQWQELFYANRLSQVTLDSFPDVVQLAGAYGFKGRTVERPSDLVEALETAFADPGPYLLNVRVTPLETVYPMVPAGGAINEMVLGPPQPVATK